MIDRKARFGLGIAVAIVLGWAGAADAQIAGAYTPNGVGPYYQPPGNFGTSYGSPSYGMPRTYSAFNSPYGGGYGYGYAPYVYGYNWFTVNGGGVSMVRPGYSVPGYYYGGTRYNTFPVPFTIAGPPSPPIGVYAPTFGPPTFYAN